MKFISFKINKHAHIYIISLIFIIIIFLSFISIIFLLLLFILFFVLYFFRDPERIIPNNNNLFVSPADGLITYVGPSEPPIESEVANKEYNKISIFLNIFDVHVNRIPSNGEIVFIKYIKGKFFNATLDKSSSENERNIIILNDKNNEKIIFVQIAGLIARRIVSDLKLNQKVKIGDRFGIIKFGSRVDIYLPKHYKIQAFEGQKLIGGQSIISIME